MHAYSSPQAGLSFFSRAVLQIFVDQFLYLSLSFFKIILNSVKLTENVKMYAEVWTKNEIVVSFL